MSEEKKQGCSGNCSTCSEKCGKEDLRVPCGDYSNIKKVIGIVSGKGGVGKSLVTSMLASSMQAKGYSCGILDADITGPSIPKAFGIKGRAKGDDIGLLPAESSTGIKIMSVNLLLENTDDPVVWRGPVISGVVRQFWQEVVWGDIDYLFVDMPPGTGDVPLTVFQSLPIDGIIIVTSPQDLVTMIVRKAYNMAKLMDIPVLGIIENMSYISCPDCGKVIYPFGKSNIEKVAADMNIPVLAQLPIDPKTAAFIDHGEAENIISEDIENAADFLADM